MQQNFQIYYSCAKQINYKSTKALNSDLSLSNESITEKRLLAMTEKKSTNFSTIN